LVLRLCELITVTVPPSLPAGLNIAILISIYYLKKKKIFCISPKKIIAGGDVQTVCFDKTGTLTENFMSLKKIVTLENDDKENINLCLANCHCLILQDNVVDGDGMELALFNYSKAKMNYSHITVNGK
jgi:P-type E1-E2 ATPase